MTPASILRRARVIVPWVLGVLVAVVLVVRTDYVTDLSAFLPSRPTPLQQLLVDQLRDGPASRTLLIAVEGGSADARSRAAAALARRLRGDAAFSSVDDGEPLSAERDREYVFRHRYLLSEAVDARHFSAPGMHDAIVQTVEGLAASGGLLLKSLVPQDPTGEMLQILEQLTPAAVPRTRDGVWVSGDDRRALLVAQTRAAGSDTDAQEAALMRIRTAFAAVAPALTVRLSGPGVFAVAARARIKGAAIRLSLISSVLVIAVLLTVYRSVPALILGLLPVATGALCGIAAVALGFGAVHGITLGFGITLIGESVDYSIYFFIQSQHRVAADGGTAGGPHAWQRLLWPTIRLGLLTSVCGFASLLPSGFPGLAQLGVYSISGLLAAGLVTRFVLPELLPARFRVHDMSGAGRRLERAIDGAGTIGRPATLAAAGALVLAALAVLAVHRHELWNRELSALSPIPAADLAYDAALRADLGTANVLDMVVVTGPDLQSVLVGAEHAGTALGPLIDQNIIGGYDSPARYLPSRGLQDLRRRSLPEPAALRANLRRAVADTALDPAVLGPFLADVEAARQGALLTPSDLHGTSLNGGFDALLLHQAGRWNALLPLHPAPGASTPDLDVVRIGAALDAAQLANTHLLDLKVESDRLYSSYLRDAVRASLGGFALIVVLLLVSLRSPARVARVLAPLVIAVLVVAAGQVLCGQRLNILHLVGLLLIVAVGSNYALFFDREAQARDGAHHLTLASLAVANLSTVIGFGLLAFSQVPVLVALGATVAPGALLALVLSAVLVSRRA